MVNAEDYFRSRSQSQPAKQLPSVKNKHVAKSGKIGKQYPPDKCSDLRTKLLKADISESDRIQNFTEFLRKVLPEAEPLRPSTIETRPKLENVDIPETRQKSPTVGVAIISCDEMSG